MCVCVCVCVCGENKNEKTHIRVISNAKLLLGVSFMHLPMKKKKKEE